MKVEDFFPQKLALGSNFCNRINEQELLRGNINGARPTLITSPRRYGKTSLGVYVVEKLRIPYSHIDLFPLINAEDVQNAILSAIASILAAIESSSQKALKMVSDFFTELSVNFKFVGTQVKVDVARDAKNNSKTILNALKNLDEVLIKKRKKAVLFFDEFQRLTQMPEAEVIEGAIRHVAQKSDHIVFLFSGSNRHLIGKMFDDSSRPLYKLCDRIVLNRIHREDYIDFLQKMSIRTWKQCIDDEAVEVILDLTECHSYYVNILCSRLWRAGALFNSKEVLLCWHNYAIEEKSTVSKELESLSVNQFKLLVSLARYGNIDAPLGDLFLSFAAMPLSSVRQSLKVLLEKDYLYQDRENNYCVLDPLIKYVLVKRPD